MNVFKSTVNPISNTRASFLKLSQPKTNHGKKRCHTQHQIFGTAYRILWKPLRALIPTNTE